jgi:type VI protein secretion system component Hcp
MTTLLLSLPGITGGCNDAGHEGCLVVESFDLDLQRKLGPSGFPGTLTIIRKADASTPALVWAFEARTVHASAEVRVLDHLPAGGKVLHEKYVLSSPIVVAAIDWDARAGDPTTETIALTYAGIAVERSPS